MINPERARIIARGIAAREALTALDARDWPRWLDAFVDMERDPRRWCCAALDAVGVARTIARGDTAAEVRAKAQRQIADFDSSQPIFSRWTFIVYPPTPWP